MQNSIIYKLTAFGRISQLFFGLLYGGGGILISSAFFPITPNRLWLEYIFALPVILIFLFLSSRFLLNGFRSSPRISVTELGFVYFGVLKKRSYLWSNIIYIKPVIDGRYHERWLKIQVNLNSGKTEIIKLDFTDLSPDRGAFLNNTRQLAPFVQMR